MPSNRPFVLSIITLLLISGLVKAAPAFAGSKEKILYNFCSQAHCVDGLSPSSSLIFDGNGNLYGSAPEGGANGGGVVFQLSPDADGGWTQKVLYSFCPNSPYDCTDGVGPSGSLLLDAAGNLYGTTGAGGYYDDYGCGSGCGAVFQLKPAADGTWTENVLYAFGDFPDGRNPQGGVVFDATGNLYGTTLYGGTTGGGNVFRLSPSQGKSWTEHVLYEFPYHADPAARLAIDSSGNLYGTTTAGGSYQCPSYDPCGSVFEVSPGAKGTWTEKTLHSFNGSDGWWPLSTVVFDTAGNMYGTTELGGDFVSCPLNGCGVVFRLERIANGKWREKVLRQFHRVRFPLGGVVLDAAGNLYGTTPCGGRFAYGNYCPGTGSGVVFKLSPATDGKWAETTVHGFGNNGDGANPAASLIFDAAGNLYGTTLYGGANGWGTVFEITP